MKTTSVLAMFAALVAAIAGLAYFTGNPGRTPAPAAAPPVANADGKTPADGKEAPPADAGPDFHLENPFKLDLTAAAKPQASTEAVEFDFGAMAPDEERTHKFSVRNTGKAPLTLAKGRYQCKCTMPTLKKGEVLTVQPGEETFVEMTWKPIAPEEMFQKSVNIWSNDPDHPQLTFNVRGKVVPHIIAEPASYTLGLIRNETGGDFKGLVGSQTDVFEIVEATSDNPQISVTTTKLEGADRPAEFTDAKALFRVEGKIAPSDKVGTVRGILTLKTNLETHPVVEINVGGHLTGPFTVVGTGWDQVNSGFDLGRVDTSKGKAVKYSIFLPRTGEEIKFETIESKPNIARITAVKDESFTAADRERHELTVEILPGAPKAEFSNARPVVVKVKSNHPNVAEATFRVMYRGY